MCAYYMRTCVSCYHCLRGRSNIFWPLLRKNEWRMHTEVSIEIYSNDIFWQK